MAISTSAVLIRHTLAPPLVTTANRLLLAGGLLLAFALVKQRHDVAEAIRRHTLLLGVAGLLLGVHIALWTTSLFWTSVASAVFLIDSHPAMVALAARGRLGERTPPGVWFGIAATALGGGLIASGDFQLGGRALLGDLMAVAGAAAFAGYLVIGREVRAGLGIAAYAGIVYAVAGCLIGAAAIASGSSLLAFAEHDFPLWLALVLGPTLGGHTVFNWVLRYVPASVVAVSFLGEPVGTTMLAWWVLAEAPATFAVLGGALVLVGLYVAFKASE